MRRFLQYSIVATALFLNACKHEETIGPRIVNLYAPFKVNEGLTIDNNNPDFSTGAKVNIKAKFDKYVAWKITILGVSSGAIKVFSGASPEVDVKWAGTSDGLPFNLEKCDVKLSYANFPDSSVVPLTVKGVRNYDDDAIIISNFKVSKVANGVYADTDTSVWNSDYPPTATASTNPLPIDGNAYLTGSGTAQAGKGAFVDFVTIRPVSADKNYGKFFPLPNDPANVWLNLLVYCTLKDATLAYKSAKLTIVIMEENGNIGSIDILPDGEGWKLLSFNYSKMTFSTPGTAPRPDKIKAIEIRLFSNEIPLGTKVVKFAIDHLAFTVNKKFSF